MFFRIFITVTFFYLISFAQQNDSLNLLNDYNLYTDYSFEINNVGDPIISLIPQLGDNNLLLTHSSKFVRKVDYDKIQITHTDSIYSSLFYQSAYNTGGLLKTFINRPIGKYMRLNFSYDNLRSEGFYNNQQNKYGKGFVLIDYLNKNSSYNFSLSLLSLNGSYEQFGGVFYDPTVSLDLLETYLTNAITNVNLRELNFSHNYMFSSKLKLHHDLSISMFERDYVDSNPNSFHYALTPFLFGITDYGLNTFFNTFFNTFSISNKYLNLGLSHNLYFTNDITLNNIGDMIISLKSTDLYKENKNFNFNVEFCPIGYNKNNYLVDCSFYKKTNRFNHVFSFNYFLKKPNFYREHYNTSFSWDWNETLSSNKLFLKFNSIELKKKLNISMLFHRSSNFMYFNTLASPVQLDVPLLYANFNIQREWEFGDFYFNSGFCLQYANNDVLAIPHFLAYQKINYKQKLFNIIRFKTSLTSYLISQYYSPSFFPLTDVFYHQNSQKNQFKPIFTYDAYIYIKDFSCGLVFEHLSNFFLTEKYLISDYITPDPTIRLVVRWNFVD